MDDCKDPYGPARLQFAGRGSYGNGSAMRMTPVALFCHQNMEEAINMAYKSSLITHTNELGYNGAILQCLAIHMALRLDPTQPLDTDNFAKQLEEKMGQIEKCDSSVSSQIGVISGTDTRTVTSLLQPSNEEYQRRHAMPNFIKSSYRNKLEEMRHLLKRKPAASADKVIDVLGHFVTAYGSVPTAIYSFLRSVKDLQEPDSGTTILCEETPFQRTIRTAVSLGGDTDTIASMAGAIAGAYYGNQEIAQALLDHCEGVEQALELADSLYDSIEH
jgi:poly(ADP-ribose) glycohydrolase ARH3